MGIDLITPWRKFRLGQYKKHPCHTNRASSLGEGCVRRLVYDRTRWQDALEPSDDLKLIFQEGDKHERAVLMDLSYAGFTVIEQQVSLEWPEHQITGHVDAVVVDQETGEAYPLDIKSMSAHIWDQSFQRGGGVYEWSEVREAFNWRPWLKKYQPQITLYCLMKNCPAGILLCVNKGTGALAQVNVELDYELGEALLRKAGEVNRHVAAGTLPERIPFDDNVCPRCPYYTICLPDHAGRDPIVFIDDSEVEKLLEAREQTHEAALECERVSTRLKRWAKAQEAQEIQIGDWLVRKEANRLGHVRVSFMRLKEDEPTPAPEAPPEYGEEPAGRRRTPEGRRRLLELLQKLREDG